MDDNAQRKFFGKRSRVALFILALAAGVYILIGREAIREIRRQHTINRIMQNGGHVSYQKGIESAPGLVVSWLRLLYGQDSFTPATAVRLVPRNDDDIDLLFEIPEVESVFIDCSHITNAAVANLWKRIHPSSLSLASATFDEQIVGDLSKHSQLVSVQLNKCKVLAAGMEELLRCSPNSVLNFDTCALDEACLAKIKGNSGIKILQFTNCSLKDSDLTALHGSVAQLSLKLVESAVSESALIALREANPTWAIEFSDSQPGTSQVPTVNQYPLQNEIANLEFYNLSGPKITDRSLTMLNDAQKLKRLSLVNCSVTDDGLEVLKNLASLEYLYIYRTQVTGAGLKHLPVGLKELELRTDFNCNWDQVERCSNLQLISIYEAKTTDEDLRWIKGLDQLQSVNFGSLEVTEEGIKCIPSGTTSFFCLDGIVDSNLVSLPDRLTKLEFISLGGSQITDESCKTLAKMKSLQSIEFNQTRVTEAGVSQLQAALPQCKIGLR